MLFNFGWVEHGTLAGMGLPDRDAWTDLREVGIGAVVSLTVRRPPGRPEEAGLEARHLPIADFGVPTIEELDELLRWMHDRIESGRSVVVHCQAGVGRTGTILAAYLVFKGRTAPEAIARVRELRPGSIETAAQQDLVERYARQREASDAPDSSGTRDLEGRGA